MGKIKTDKIIEDIANEINGIFGEKDDKKTSEKDKNIKKDSVTKSKKEKTKKKFDKNSIKKKVNEKIEEMIKDAEGKVVDTVKKTSEEASDKVENFDWRQEMRKQLNATDLGLLVNDLLDNSIEDIVAEQIKKARNVYNDSSINFALSTAEAYYTKILNSQVIMTQMRSDYTKVLQKKATGLVNDKLYNLQEKMEGKWAGKLLGKTKIASTIDNVINTEIANCVNAIITDKMIADVSSDIINTVNRVYESSKKQLETQFKNEIAYYQKVEKAIKDKVELFEKEKKKYEQKMAEEVARLKKAITEQIKKIENVVISEISKVIKIDAGSITGGIGL